MKSIFFFFKDYKNLGKVFEKLTLQNLRNSQFDHLKHSRRFMKGAGKTTLMFTVSVNVLSTKFLFCVVPAGREGGRNGKYVDISRKR
jgi:hypothetical protein